MSTARFTASCRSYRFPWTPSLLGTRFASRIGERGLSNGCQRSDDDFHDSLRVELLGRELANRLAVHRLGLLNGFQIARQCPLVLVRFHALPTRWKTVHQYARFTSLHERRTGPYSHGRTPGQQNLLQCQRPVIIVGQIRTRPGATGGFEELLTVILAVVDLDVSWEQLGQMLQQHRAGVRSWRRSRGRTHPAAARRARDRSGMAT